MQPIRPKALLIAATLSTVLVASTALADLVPPPAPKKDGCSMVAGPTAVSPGWAHGLALLGLVALLRRRRS